jgi:hypothetical protein
MFSPVAGPPVSLSPLSCHHDLSTGVLRTRHRGMCSLHAVGGTCTPFPTLSPRVLAPRTLSGSPNLPLGPPRYVDCGRAEGCALNAPRLVPRQLGFPPARGSPGRGGRWRVLPILTSGPGANREVGHRQFREDPPFPRFFGAGPRAHRRPRAHRNLIRLARPPGTACGHGPFCFLWPFCFLSPPSPGDYICL